MNTQLPPASVIDFNQYKNLVAAANMQIQQPNAQVRVVFYPVYVCVPPEYVAQIQEAQQKLSAEQAAQAQAANPQPEKQVMDNVVSIYDYLGEI